MSAEDGMKASGTFVLPIKNLVMRSATGNAATIYPPLGSPARSTFTRSDGKVVTPHQWSVYDYINTIPRGKVVRYKDIVTAIGEGSPQSVGGALKNNPFAPNVPCHRVISSDLFVGGYFGEWGSNSKTGTMYNKKLELLKSEGVEFDDEGILIDHSCLWDGN